MHLTDTELWAFLLSGENVYRSGRDNSRWFLTHGRGEVREDQVRRLVREGRIRPVYNNCPDDCFHTGKTLDVEATIAERERHSKIKDAPKVYVN